MCLQLLKRSTFQQRQYYNSSCTESGALVAPCLLRACLVSMTEPQWKRSVTGLWTFDFRVSKSADMSCLDSYQISVTYEVDFFEILGMLEECACQSLTWCAHVSDVASPDLGGMYQAPIPDLHRGCHQAYACPGVKEMFPHHCHLLLQSLAYCTQPD